MDYLREKQIIDQELIEILDEQVNVADSLNSVNREIIEQLTANSKAWEQESAVQEKEKRWWKWGGIGASSLLFLLLIAQ